MKRGLASFDIYVIVSEFQDMIGCYVEKIYQLSQDEILLRIQQKAAKQKESIFIRNGELICLTRKSFNVPEKPSLFAMTLRKYLLNGKIKKITQHEFDRIIKITISRKEGDYILICELFSNGNIILCNPEGRIIRPLLKQEWASRLIKSGEIYNPPPSQTNPFSLSEQDFRRLLLKSSKDIVRTLATSMNMSGLYAEELCVRATIDKNIKVEELNEASIKRLYDELSKLTTLFQDGEIHPVFVKKKNTIIDILPFPFFSFKGVKFDTISSFSKGLEIVIDLQKTTKTKENKYKKKIAMLKRKQAQQEELIEEFRKNIVQKKLEANLIYLNFQSIEKILQEIRVVLTLKDKDEEINKILKNPLVKLFDPITNELVVVLKNEDGKGIEISLNFRKNLTENADQKYAESKKFQEKLKGAQVAVLQTKHDLKTVKEPEITEFKKEKRYKKQWWFERFRWFISSEGNIVVAGRDASSNDLVVKKYLGEGDRYAHADIHGAPSCVIKCTGINGEKLSISERTLQEACLFAGSYSRAWNQFGDASVYWVLPEQVSKTAESGEYVPKGGFIIRGKRNYYRCILEVAVGLIYLGERKMIMGGPVTAIARRVEKGYVILVPGVIKKSHIAQKLGKIFDISPDEIERVLPPGNLMIRKIIGFDLK